MVMSSNTLLWVNKNAKSRSLSHSEEVERIRLLSHAQRTSRGAKRRRVSKTPQNPSRRDEDGKVRRGSSLKFTPSLTPNWSERERRSVSFFLEVTVQKIIYPEPTFFSQILPVLAVQHAAFRHLLAAIASTHELLTQSDSGALDVFALTQCNKATELLRAVSDWQPALLLVSCILVAAYSLLRLDYTQADLSIESGLKIPLDENEDITSTDSYYEDGKAFKQILTRIGKSHGFKLWSPEISCQFDKSAAGQFLEISTNQVKGPYTSSEQVIQGFRALLIDLVAKVMRNLARGSYVDPDSTLAQEAVKQFAMFLYYWEQLYNQVGPNDVNGRLELKQLRIGFNNAYLVWFTKVVSPAEKTFDAYPNICSQSLDLAEEVADALYSGLPVIHMDRIVNGSLFSFGMCCRRYSRRKRVIDILRSQALYQDGLVNFLRGTILDMYRKTEYEVWGETDCESSLPLRRLILTSMSCTGPEKTIRLECLVVSPEDETLQAIASQADWTTYFETEPSTEVVHNCLQGILAAYRVYGKPRPSQAPLGYVREMQFRGRSIPISFEPGWEPS